MSRSQRLLDLIQTMRRYRRPVSGKVLAEETGISIRTLYRDIATLQAQGAHIEGEPGLGYVLRPGFMLPPLMFTEEEIEALVLGSRWVAKQPDNRLSTAARDALNKIAAVLPDDLRESVDTSALLVGPGDGSATDGVDLADVRKAIRNERKLDITYRDGNGSQSSRLIWPFALGFFDKMRVIVAWCELRQDFRHFRTDRLSRLEATDIRYPKRRQVPLQEWRDAQGIAQPR